MTLEELLDKFINSDRENWNTISCWGANSGPSFKNKFSFWKMWDGQPNVLNHSSFSNVASYKPDLSITFAWGLSVYDNEEDGRIDKPWATSFSDPRPGHSNWVDFYYNNALVFREAYVVVDGGRCKLPFPQYREDGSTYCSRKLYDFMRKLNQITGSDNFDNYFNLTGIEVVGEEWDY
jgi:hypothetical protein